jgi:ribonuclease HII
MIAPRPQMPLSQTPRLRPDFARESELWAQGLTRIAGVDEAGRGPLAGPVVAAAVVLSPDFSSPHFSSLDDSKQMSQSLREMLFDEITPNARWGIGVVDAATIDEINIRQASWRAMQIAVDNLCERASTQSSTRFAPAYIDYVLIDGLPYGEAAWPYEAIVKGDAKSLSIAAASVLAKVWRDRLMIDFDAQFPAYGFARHKGYGSPQHLRALNEHGVCPIHRRTFKPVREVLTNERS